MFDIATYAELTKAMKSADTTAENKATPWARLTIATLLTPPTNEAGDATFTFDHVVAALIGAYKPRTAAGKPATTIGALPASPRGRVNTIKYCMTNIGTDGVRAAMEAFVADTKEGPQSIAELHALVKAAVKAAGAALAGEEPAKEEGEEPGEASAPRGAVDILTDVAAFISHLTDAEMADTATSEAVNAVLSAIRDRTTAFAATLVEAEKLAA